MSEAANSKGREPIPIEALCLDLERVGEIVDRAPTRDDYDEHGHYSVSTYYRRYDSWFDALEAADLEPNRSRKPDVVTGDEAIAAIQSVAEELGRAPTMQDMKERGDVSPSACVSSFGTWTNAVEAAGLDPEWTATTARDDYLDDIRSVAADLGWPPTTNDYNEHGTHAAKTSRKWFDSWEETLEAAGFEDTTRENRIETLFRDRVADRVDELVVGVVDCTEAHRQLGHQLVDDYAESAPDNDLRSRSTDAVAAGCLWAALRSTDSHVTRDQFHDYVDVDSDRLTSTYRLIVRELNLPIGLPDVHDRVDTVADRVDASPLIQQAAHDILDPYVDAGDHSGKHPMGVAAAALYAANRHLNNPDDFTAHSLADDIGSCYATITARYDELEPYTDRIDLDVTANADLTVVAGALDRPDAEIATARRLLDDCGAFADASPAVAVGAAILRADREHGYSTAVDAGTVADIVDASADAVRRLADAPTDKEIQLAGVPEYVPDATAENVVVIDDGSGDEQAITGSTQQDLLIGAVSHLVHEHDLDDRVDLPFVPARGSRPFLVADPDAHDEDRFTWTPVTDSDLYVDTKLEVGAKHRRLQDFADICNVTVRTPAKWR